MNECSVCVCVCVVMENDGIFILSEKKKSIRKSGRDKVRIGINILTFKWTPACWLMISSKANDADEWKNYTSEKVKLKC